MKTNGIKKGIFRIHRTPDPAGQPEHESLYQCVGQNDDNSPRPLDPDYPPGTDDIPQQAADKGIVEYGVGIGMMPNFLFHLEQGYQGNKDHEEKR
jgi:hypothetical protein